MNTLESINPARPPHGGSWPWELADEAALERDLDSVRTPEQRAYWKWFWRSLGFEED